MRIVSIELENIKSYERARVEFSEGVNAIVGRNGAGKSTLLEAVGFALFSCLDYAQTAFLREGAKQGSVSVGFESNIDGRVYVSVRRLGGSGAKQAIYDPDVGVNLAEGGADVERFLRIHLGLLPNADLARIFKDAVGVPQGTLTAAFLLNTAARKVIFDALLQVDDYKLAFTRLLESKNLLLARANDLKQAIARMEGMLAALPEMEETARNNALQLGATGQALAEAQSTLAELHVTLQGLEEKRAALLAAEQECVRARSAFAAGQTAQQVAQLRLQEAIDARGLVEASQSGHDRYLDAQATRQRLAQRVTERQQVQLERSGAVSSLDLANLQAEQSANELERIAAAEATVAQLAAAAAQQIRLEEQGAEAQVQQGEYRGAERLLDQAERSLSQEEASLDAIRAGHAGLATAEAELSLTVNLLSDLSLQKAKLEDQRSEKTAEGIAFKVQDENLAKVEGATCPICEGPLTASHRQHLIDRNKVRKDLLRDEIRTLSDAAAKLQAQIQESEQMRRAQEATLNKLPSISALEGQEARVAQVRAQRDAAKVRMAELSTAPDRLLEIESALKELGNPAQQIAIAQATAGKRAATESAHQRAVAEAADASARLVALDARLTAFSDLDAALESVRHEEQDHFPAYQVVLSNRQAAETVAARTKAADAATVECESQQDALSIAENAAAEASTRFDANAWSLAQAESARLYGVVGSLSSTEQMLSRQRDELNHQIALLCAEQKNLADAQTKLVHLEQKTTVLDKLRGVINQAGPYVTAHLIHKVSVTSAQIYGDLTGDFSQVLSWGEDYSISLEVNGRKRGFQSLSGGEQMVAALAVRLALLKTITGISFAFFDEPTAHLDGPRREALAGQIVSFKGLRQLFVISHDDTFEHATENTIRLMQMNGASCVMDGEMG